MKPGRVVALVVGCLLVLPGVGLLFGGGALGLGYAFARDDDGYFRVTLDRLETQTVALTVEDVDLRADSGSPGWLLDALDADVRLRFTSPRGDAVFVGVGREADVDTYLEGVAHDEVTDLDGGRAPEYRAHAGDDDVALPDQQQFWVARTAGPGTQQLDWEATSGRWAVVVMNADGSPGVAVDGTAAVKAGFVLPLAVILGVAGLVTTAVAVTLILLGAAGARAARREAPPSPETPGAGPAAEADAGRPAPAAVAAPTPGPTGGTPVVLEAHLDPGLSRWQWLVKWVLAIPHLIVLAFLWVALVVLTIVAGVSILFTGVYPRGIFDFNVGVLRWTWRVTFYATGGGIGTDRYPPFSLDPEPAYPATLAIAYPGQLSRGLVLVKWLLAVPHLLIVGVLIGGSFGWVGETAWRVPGGGGGVLAVLVVVAGFVLLFTGRYPQALFDLIVGFNRWIYRVAAYVGLMTDQYPPFRLDQGGAEPSAAPPPSGPPAPSDATTDVRAPQPAR